MTDECIVRHEWNGNEETITEVGKIVRCKDCKHRTRTVCGKIEMWECNHLQYEKVKVGVSDDWFCADGVKKE